jgi:hypothetical protein
LFVCIVIIFRVEEESKSINYGEDRWQAVALTFHSGFLLQSFLDPEDVGVIFLRNAGLTFSGIQGAIPERRETFNFRIINNGNM